MGWEWRAFVKNDGDGELLDLLEAFHISASVEERSDCYQALSPNFGFKRRGGGGWELKLCTKRNFIELEKFKKYKLSSPTELVNFLSSDRDALAAAGRPEAEAWVTLQKSRAQARVASSTPGSSLFFEQTDIDVEVAGRQVGRWRSFCVEGGDGPEDIAAFVNSTPELQKLADNTNGGASSAIMGYPAFVAMIAAVNSGAVVVPSEAATGALELVAVAAAEPNDPVFPVCEITTSVVPKTNTIGSSSNSSSSSNGIAVVGGDSELWVVRHGERVDETEDYDAWRAATPKHRRFDPELTEDGAQQARDVGTFLVHCASSGSGSGSGHLFGLLQPPPAPRAATPATAAARSPPHAAACAAAAEKFACTIFCSPLSRTLSTAHEIAQILGNRGGGDGGGYAVATVEVRVVFGLSECAAAVRQKGSSYRSKLSFLDLKGMQALCPEVSGIEERAPVGYSETCVWLLEETQRRRKQQEKQQQGGLSCCLVVTHREGIRDMMGAHVRLPYCAVAKFRATSTLGTLEGSTGSAAGGSGFATPPPPQKLQRSGGNGGSALNDEGGAGGGGGGGGLGRRNDGIGEREGVPCAVVGSTQFHPVALSDRSGAPISWR